MIKPESRWRTLVYVYIFMLVYSLVFQVIPPILGFIVPSLGLSHTQAGALMSFFALPGIFISIPGGILTDLHGPGRVSMAALAIAFAGSLLVGLGGAFPLLLAGRLITGIGAGMIAIVASQMIARWFSKGDLGTAMGIYNTVMPVGTIFALNVFGRIAAASNWRLPVILTALYSLLVLLFSCFRHPGLPAEEKPLGEEGETRKQNKTPLLKTGASIWLVAFIWMMYNASAISYLTFAGDYFTSAGYDPGYAAFLSSLFMIGSLLCSPLAGYLTDRVGREEYFIAGGASVLTLLLLLVPRSSLNPLLLGAFIGIAAAFVPSPVFSLVPKFLPAHRTGLGYGISSTCLNIGVLLGPLLVGLAYDRTLSYISGFNLMALFSLAAAAIALLLRFTGRRARSKGGQYPDP